MNTTFSIPDVNTKKLDYMAQAASDEMYAFAHLFRQQSPSLGLPVTYALNCFFQKKQPYGKISTKQQGNGQQLLSDLTQRFKDALTRSGWIYAGVSPNNGKTEIWQPPQM
jgi:hypothetical protein